MKKVFFVIGAAMMLAIGLNSCSNDAGDEIIVDSDGNIITNYNASEVPSFDPSDVNKMRVTWSSGYTDTCWLYRPYCGLYDNPLYVSDNHLKYPMVFTAVVKNSNLFELLQFDICSMSPTRFENLRVGDTFVNIPYGPGDIYMKAWGGFLYSEVPSEVNGVYPWESKGGSLGGVIQVVDKKTSGDGKTRITLSLQDLKFYDYDKELKNQIHFKLNGLIEFEVLTDGIYPLNQPKEPTMEELTTPNDGLLFFMMDALNDEYQGRHVLFSEGTEAQECLIINSEKELQEVYKGDWKTRLPVPFESCTLVIGHSYGEDGGVTVDDFDLIDKGDTYQLNLTLNDNVNTNYAYSPDYVDLYFWKLIPKVENKPVIFNRITQEASSDPLGTDTPYFKIRNRWLLESYTDAEGNLHQVGEWGDENYFIEFKEDGSAEGRIGANTFSCNYTLPYTLKLTNEENSNQKDLHYGVFNLWDWKATGVDEEDPISKVFMRINEADQFKLWSTRFLVLRISDKEVLSFFREGVKKDYGYTQ